MIKLAVGRSFGLAPILLLSGCLGELNWAQAPVPEVATFEQRPSITSEAEVTSSTPPAAAESAKAALPLEAPVPEGTVFAYMLMDLETGEVMAEEHPDLPLIPGSTIKLATAVVAEDVLGPDYQQKTELRATGDVVNGVMRGDLILKGYGDPVLDVADLMEFVLRLKSLGISKVDGRFLIDDYALPRFPEINADQPAEAGYNSGIGALSVAFNRVRVRWAADMPEQIRVLPPLEDAQFDLVGPSELPPSGAAWAGEDRVVWQLSNGIQQQREMELPVKDAGLHAGAVFRWIAALQGVELPAPARAPTPRGARTLIEHQSPPLRTMLRDMLIYSNNMMAETIGLTVAQHLGRTPSSLADAGAAMLDHLKTLLPEVDWQGASFGNHSGLDSGARLTARQLAAIARYSFDRTQMPALLPSGGWSGTLSRRFDGEKEALRVWAKTGAMNYSSTLAGFLFPDGGRPTVVVTMVTDIAKRQAYDALPMLTQQSERQAGRWNASAKRLQDELIARWLRPAYVS